MPGFHTQGEYNFGHCQSQVAKKPGPADSTKIDNPAVFTGQNVVTGVWCQKTLTYVLAVNGAGAYPPLVIGLSLAALSFQELPH
jgi:hypothetical protein